MSLISSCLGHPRIGAGRELKRALESFWSKKTGSEVLLGVARELRATHWRHMRELGISVIPSHDFSLYDHVLDTAVMLGAVPARFQAIDEPLTRYFAMARGLQDPAKGLDIPAMEMTKWFDTNYHFIVPELEVRQKFQLSSERIISEVREARLQGIETRPVILGPVTFLMISKGNPAGGKEASTLDLLAGLLPVYAQLLERLAREGVAWVQLDEPALVLDLDPRATSAYRQSLTHLTSLAARPKLMLTTYFGEVAENLPLLTETGCEGVHVDLVRAPEQLAEVLAALGPDTVLSAGVIDGRNIWRADLDAAEVLLGRAIDRLGRERVQVAPSCSLLHTPVARLDAETTLDAELKSWLAFSTEKLEELAALAAYAGTTHASPKFAEAREALAARRASPRTRNPEVRDRVAALTPSMSARFEPYEARAEVQRAKLRLPALPTTTIGSFPQTADVRKVRAQWRAGHMTDADYQRYLREETRRAVERQDAIGLDVLVHGEFERNDMVEYFGEQLEGFAFTENAWVQSYGSRCVKPPILFGDVSRPRPMTVEWAKYAQSLTKKPMKGMLTGPVTILQWSFVRNDQPRGETCRQIALALRDEVQDLEASGLPIIQVDEAAIREGLPLRKGARREYLAWAVESFRTATSGVRAETQIHTHMCYSDFGEILEAVAAMDADVLSIETSRSRMELLRDFGRYRYPNEVGPGVYDIHSPRVPTTDEMVELLRRASAVLPVDRLWVNPDCGLKTRGWAEVTTALERMVEAARITREHLRGA